MDANTYLIPFLILAFLLVFPVAFWAKKKFYPDEYKKEVDTLLSTRFLILAFALILVSRFVKIFLEKKTPTQNELLFSAAVLAILLISFLFIFRRAMPKKKIFILIIMLGLVLFVIRLASYYLVA